eukprot:jgi/Bigna1/72400/fgenesh1_pg.19_\
MGFTRSLFIVPIRTEAVWSEAEVADGCCESPLPSGNGVLLRCLRHSSKPAHSASDKYIGGDRYDAILALALLGVVKGQRDEYGFGMTSLLALIELETSEISVRKILADGAVSLSHILQQQQQQLEEKETTSISESSSSLLRHGKTKEKKKGGEKNHKYSTLPTQDLKQQQQQHNHLLEIPEDVKWFFEDDNNDTDADAFISQNKQACAELSPSTHSLPPPSFSSSSSSSTGIGIEGRRIDTKEGGEDARRALMITSRESKEEAASNDDNNKSSMIENTSATAAAAAAATALVKQSRHIQQEDHYGYGIYRPRDCVQIQGLKSNKGRLLNGRFGHIVGFDAKKERHLVVLMHQSEKKKTTTTGGGGGREGGQHHCCYVRKGIKHSNLKKGPLCGLGYLDEIVRTANRNIKVGSMDDHDTSGIVLKAVRLALNATDQIHIKKDKSWSLDESDIIYSVYNNSSPVPSAGVPPWTLDQIKLNVRIGPNRPWRAFVGSFMDLRRPYSSSSMSRLAAAIYTTEDATEVKEGEEEDKTLLKGVVLVAGPLNVRGGDGRRIGGDSDGSYVKNYFTNATALESMHKASCSVDTMNRVRNQLESWKHSGIDVVLCSDDVDDVYVQMAAEKEIIILGHIPLQKMKVCLHLMLARAHEEGSAVKR